MNLSKKYKDHDTSTGYIEEYLMKGKKIAHKKINPNNLKQTIDSGKIIKARKLWELNICHFSKENDFFN